MRIAKLLIAVFMTCLLCSCGGSEPNDVAFVVALGFDKAEENYYQITVQFAKVTQISGGASEEGGKAGSEIIQNITVEAPDLYSGINTANHIISKKFSLSHAKLIVFSRELAEEGIGDLVDTIVRSNEIKPDVFMTVASESAKGYLTEVKPVVEVNPAKYYQLVYGENESGGIPKTNLHNFYFDKEIQSKSSVIPLAGVTQTDGSAEENAENKAHGNAPINESGFEYRVKNYTAGEVAVNGENKSEAMGMAVFKGDKMVGTLGSIDGELYNLLSGNLKRSYISFRNGQNDKLIVVRIFQDKKPSYRIDIKKKKVKIKLFVESDLYSKPSENFDVEALEEEITKEINAAGEQFIKKVRDEMDCDPLGLEEKMEYNFLTNHQLEQYDFKNDFKNYDIEVNTEFRIRRIGMKL